MDMHSTYFVILSLYVLVLIQTERHLARIVDLQYFTTLFSYFEYNANAN